MQPKPIALTLVVSRLNRGGTERQVLELARALDPAEFKLTLISFYSENQLWEEANKISGLNCISLGKRSRWDLFFPLRLIGVLKRCQPDIVYSFLPAANLLSLFTRPFFPKTKYIWGVRSSHMDFSFFDKFSACIWQLECWLSHFTTRVIANSEAGKAHAIAHGANDKKIVVVPNGIDTQTFMPQEEARQAMRERLLVAEDELLVGSVGRFDPLKDYETFLEAASKVAEKRKDVKFILVGVKSTDGKLNEKFAKTSLEGRLLFIGLVPNPVAYFQAMDLYVSASLTEGFSNSVAEAMSTGVPAVVTDVGDSKKIVGETGWVVSPKNRDEMAEAILLQLSRMELAKSEMAQAARQRIVKNFSTENLTRQMTAFFKELTGKTSFLPQRLTTSSPS